MTLVLPTTLADLFPANTVCMPRAAPEGLRWVHDEAYRAETATGVYVAITGDMPLICHRNVATPLILDFFREAGLEPARYLTTYETHDEAAAIARDHVRRGAKLAITYPPPPLPEGDAALSIPLSLYYWLNDKANQPELVDARYMPPFRIFPLDSVPSIREFAPGGAVFVKVCREGVSGGGSDVRYCPKGGSRDAAVEWVRSRGSDLTGVRVEEALEIATCWCVNVGVSESDVHYVGAATQLFSAPARQCGSRIAPAESPPSEIIDAARAVADRARLLGFTGVAGFDIGVTPSGRPYVFDLNFRANACTPQVLLHRAAVERAEAAISQSWNSAIEGPLGPALDRIADFAGRGGFVPVRLYEATPGTSEKSMITGFIVGNTLDEVEAVEAGMRTALGDLPLQASDCSSAQAAFSPYDPAADDNRTSH